MQCNTMTPYRKPQIIGKQRNKYTEGNYKISDRWLCRFEAKLFRKSLTQKDWIAGFDFSSAVFSVKNQQKYIHTCKQPSD